MSISELIHFCNVDYYTLWRRLRDGWRVVDALKQPVTSGGGRQHNDNPLIVNPDKNRDTHNRYKTTVSNETKERAKTNKKLEDLIEQRRLEKELNDY